MKWTNIGNEFNIIGERLIKHPILYIYGAGDHGQKLYTILNALGIQLEFIDGNKLKQENGYLNCKVISPMELFSRTEKELVIIAAFPNSAMEIQNKLELNGYILNEDFYMMEDFLAKVLPIYSVYVAERIYMDSIGFLTTTVCNLNCDGCLNFTQYNKHQKHRDLNEIKDTLDLFFNKINYVNFFSYTGGEPLLFPQIDEILEYIGTHFRDQIDTFAISTNCTIVPKDSTCEIIRKYGFKVYIDDYSKYVERSKVILPEMEDKFNQYQIDYVVNKGTDGYWIDLAPFTTDNSHMNENELVTYRNRCGEPYRELRDGRIYSCNYASFAIKAGIQDDSRNDWYDLKEHKPEDNKKLVEFIMGYTEQGYVDFCKHCAGFIPINPYKKPIGKQVPR